MEKITPDIVSVGLVNCINSTFPDFESFISAAVKYVQRRWA